MSSVGTNFVSVPAVFSQLKLAEEGVPAAGASIATCAGEHET